MDNKKKLLPVLIFVVAIVLFGYLIYFGYQSQTIQQGTQVTGEISPDQAQELASDFINNNLISGSGMSVNIVDVTERSGIYEINLLVQGESFSSYLTKDGKIFFAEGIVIDEFDPDWWMQPEMMQPAPTQPQGVLPEGIEDWESWDF